MYEEIIPSRRNRLKCNSFKEVTMNKKTVLLTLIFLLSPMISHALDTSSVMSDFRFQEIMADSAPQQAANGTYRTVELLNLIVSGM